MIRIRPLLVTLAGVALLASLTLFLTGCPPRNGSVKVSVALGNSDDKLFDVLLSALDKNKAVVDIDDIESLTVTVTEVSLDYAGTDDDGEGEGEGETEKGVNEDNGQKIVVFEGAQPVNIVDLMLDGLPELLSTADIPAGHYTKIRLEIQDPELVLKSNTTEVITKVKLTANGHLFICEEFDLPEGQDSLILLDFGGIHLVLNGNGRYVLTPQLRAEITVQDAAVMLSGEIVSVDMDADSMVVQVGDDEITVFYSGAAIFLPADMGTATGTETDLAPGLSVDVVGLLSVDGTVTASEIHILAP
jgi:hypothetical protein